MGTICTSTFPSIVGNTRIQGYRIIDLLTTGPHILMNYTWDGTVIGQIRICKEDEKGSHELEALDDKGKVVRN